MPKGRFRPAATSSPALRIGRRIQAFREERGWDRRTLAALACVRPAFLHLYEEGRRIPPTRTLQRLAHTFRVPVDALLEWRAGEDPLLLRFRSVSALGPVERTVAVLLLDLFLDLLRVRGPLNRDGGTPAP